MSKKEVFDKVVTICKEVFENETLELTEESCAQDIVEWDSISHLNIISDIEDEFKISFTLEEISNAKNLGELIEALMRHIKA